MNKCLLALLLLASPAFAGDKIRVASAAPSAAYAQSELELGDVLEFNFSSTKDGAKPFGGKPYRVEIESRDDNTKPQAFRGMVEVELEGGKTEVADCAAVFAGNDSPEWVVVRVIVDNRTVYRHIIKIIKRSNPLPPVPSPYTDRILRAFAADKGTAELASTHVAIFKAANGNLANYAKGSDLWNAIDADYKRTQPLVQTRLVISTILFDTTKQYYDATLTKDDRKAISRVLTDIQAALEACIANPTPPGPDPIPVGPKKLFMVVIEETSQSASNRGSYFNNASLANKIKSSGHKYRIADKDVKNASGQTPPDLVPYIGAASGKTLPWLFLVDQVTGKIYHQGALPTTPEALTELLTKVGG